MTEQRPPAPLALAMAAVQVRALSGGSYKSDEAKFVEYAEASEALCRAYVDCHTRLQREGKPGGGRGEGTGRAIRDDKPVTVLRISCCFPEWRRGSQVRREGEGRRRTCGRAGRGGGLKPIYRYRYGPPVAV